MAVFRKNRPKKLTECAKLGYTYKHIRDRRLAMKSAEIAQEPKRCPALGRFGQKIASVSVDTWVCGVLGLKFAGKEAVRSSLVVLGFWSYGPSGLKMGSFRCAFPFEGN